MRTGSFTTLLYVYQLIVNSIIVDVLLWGTDTYRGLGTDSREKGGWMFGKRQTVHNVRRTPPHKLNCHATLVRSTLLCACW